jgi:hypothetical protein
MVAIQVRDKYSFALEEPLLQVMCFILATLQQSMSI